MKGHRRADKDLARAVALDKLGEQGIERAPMDPFTIAESLVIVVQASDELEGSFSGCLLQAAASFEFRYSTGTGNMGYQRFTVVHELGHFSLTAFTSGASYEREADLFGVELLIPEFLFHKHRRDFPLGLDGMKGPAEVFQTSWSATGIVFCTPFSRSPSPRDWVRARRERDVFGRCRWERYAEAEYTDGLWERTRPSFLTLAPKRE